MPTPKPRWSRAGTVPVLQPLPVERLAAVAEILKRDPPIAPERAEAFLATLANVAGAYCWLRALARDADKTTRAEAREAVKAVDAKAAALLEMLKSDGVAAPLLFGNPLLPSPWPTLSPGECAVTEHGGGLAAFANYEGLIEHLEALRGACARILGSESPWLGQYGHENPRVWLARVVAEGFSDTLGEVATGYCSREPEERGRFARVLAALFMLRELDGAEPGDLRKLVQAAVRELKHSGSRSSPDEG
jgi:hypothetical protein